MWSPVGSWMFFYREKLSLEDQEGEGGGTWRYFLSLHLRLHRTERECGFQCAHESLVPVKAV